MQTGGQELRLHTTFAMWTRANPLALIVRYGSRRRDGGGGSGDGKKGDEPKDPAGDGGGEGEEEMTTVRARKVRDEAGRKFNERLQGNPADSKDAGFSWLKPFMRDKRVSLRAVNPANGCENPGIPKASSSYP